MEKFLNMGETISINANKSKENYFNEVKEIAEKNNGKLLSTEWEGWNHKYLFSFQDGREFIKNAKDLKKYGWPKNPDIFFKLSAQQTKTPIELLEELKKIANTNNGELISPKWNGTHYKYLFSFQDGREFLKSAKELKKSGWPKDPDVFFNLSIQQTRNPTELFKQLQELIETNGGKLLSTEWIGSDQKYVFLDKNDTLREKRIDSIKVYLKKQKDSEFITLNKQSQNKAIPKTLEKTKEFVEQKSFNRTVKITKNHNSDIVSKLKNSEVITMDKQSQTKIVPKRIKNTQNTKELMAQRNFNRMVEIAKSHNGDILSKKWMGTRSEYEFIDSENNIFSCKFENLIRGTWSTPRGLISEPICRQILEFMFSEKFIKTKKILTGQVLNRDQPLELDGYSKNLKVAFEYQGWPGHWDQNHRDYLKINKRDNLKKEYCKKLDIILIYLQTKMELNFKFKQEQ